MATFIVASVRMPINSGVITEHIQRPIPIPFVTTLFLCLLFIARVNAYSGVHRRKVRTNVGLTRKVLNINKIRLTQVCIRRRIPRTHHASWTLESSDALRLFLLTCICNGCVFQ